MSSVVNNILHNNIPMFPQEVSVNDQLIYIIVY